MGAYGKVGGDVGAAAPEWASAGGDGGVAGGEGGWAREYASPLVSSPIGQIDTASSGPSEAADNANPTSDAHDVKAGTGAAVAPVVLGACAVCSCFALHAAAAAPPPLTLTLLSLYISADVVCWLGGPAVDGYCNLYDPAQKWLFERHNVGAGCVCAPGLRLPDLRWRANAAQRQLAHPRLGAPLVRGAVYTEF